ncbi:MAG TPA: acetylglutamate kinase [Planctomycetota bacterium]|nr:acetylglutamate kinase [Planctomycetota bacterium]
MKERAVRDSVLVRVIKQALPYLRQHRRQVMVIKLGGELAGNPDALRSLAEDISLLLHVGVRLVVVHGGGPQATEVSKRLGLTPTMVEGRRVTDEQTLDVAKMVFAGKINTDILSALRAQGVRAVGLSGVDADIVSAARRKPTEMRDEATGETKLVDFGYVGDVVAVDGSLLLLLMENGYVPVLASLGADSEGEILNINADTVASVIAQDLRAGKLISLTAVPGVLKDKDDPTTMIPLLTTAQARALLEGGTVGGGLGRLVLAHDERAAALAREQLEQDAPVRQARQDVPAPHAALDGLDDRLDLGPHAAAHRAALEQRAPARS